MESSPKKDPEAQAAASLDEVPDPDEDDLDDLDDMLGEFSAVNLDSSKAPAASSEAPPDPVPQSTQKADEEISEDEFARQLQAGMADLLGELEKSPEMQEQLEDMFKHIAAESSAGASSSAPSTADAGADASFQDTIRRTMERMQTSGDQATAAAASEGADDFMSEMLKQLSSGDFNAEGSDEDLSKMLMGMMEQLTNKDILYEPMKELDEKFPDWFVKNKDKTPAPDLKRYEEQQGLVREIVAKFEESSYSDSNPSDREYIVDRMQKMQASGTPPSDLVGDMASAQDAFNAADDQCNPQ
ncbi:Pex19 protein [Ophiocordyceps camponoti-floridani]|uniref:Pex19 protein n=1 Tax=Ophiocordyceps camponoti-floridani TaxID=2030778 RepID=A0A8H4QCP5_9HYPO|nr:Pex19 protein [Ophiocordyceps camponoti-floridani]